MKKYLLILFIIIISIFFTIKYIEHSKYYLGKEYRNEVNALIDEELPKCRKQIDNIFIEAENEKDLTKKQEFIETSIDDVEFKFYFKLLEIIKKYKEIDEESVATDFTTDLAIFVYPYLKHNNINISNLKFE